MTILWGEARNLNYIDWDLHEDYVDYTSYFITNPKVHGQGQKKFQSNYVHIFTDNSDTRSNLYLSGRWDYATSGNTGRWSNEQLVVMGGSNYNFRKKRVKIRGAGIELDSLPLVHALQRMHQQSTVYRLHS